MQLKHMAIELSELNDEQGNPIFNITIIQPDVDPSLIDKMALDVPSRHNLHTYFLKQP